MGNTMKMDKVGVLYRLFTAGWGNRKINNTIGINRRKISRYKHQWELQNQQSQEPLLRVDHTPSLKPRSACCVHPKLL